jgi:N-acetylmuramoyl-L-alanine amidase
MDEGACALTADRTPVSQSSPALRWALAVAAITVTAVASVTVAASGGDAHGDHTAGTVAPAAPARPHTILAADVLPLAGKVVGIDPGHNGGNFNAPAAISRIVWNGRESETCDTSGTETDSGYTEALFNIRVATFLRQDLTRDGARVVLTRTSNTGVGPCVNRRSAIINDAHADVAVDIHADGGPPGGRGFTILEPVADGPNDHVIKSSDRFGADLRAAMLAQTSMPLSSYDGVNGFVARDDLAGLNLTTVPKVLIECGNMRNATDAALITSTAYQQAVARAIEAAILRFLA